MKNIVSCHKCTDYNIEKIEPLLEKLYSESSGSEVSGKSILLKPNILFDEKPERAVTTHPIFLEAVVLFLKKKGAAKIYIGDAPAIHSNNFKAHKSGIFQVCERTGAEWVFFGNNPCSIQIGSKTIPIANIIRQTDLFISLPKMKTHELMYYTGAIKNTYGLIPGLNKAKQHAYHSSSRSMSSFLLDLNEVFLPDFIFMDAITAMQGAGPGNGFPYAMQLLLASTNPLALDIVASSIMGYRPLDIETNTEGLKRKKWLSSPDDIIIQGEDIHKLIKTDFVLIKKTPLLKMSLNIVMRRIPILRQIERKPKFIKKHCVGCKACINICPVKAISVNDNNPTNILFNKKECIHCFCCHEICPHNAIEIR